jgi:hypothetical protein
MAINKQGYRATVTRLFPELNLVKSEFKSTKGKQHKHDYHTHP